MFRVIIEWSVLKPGTISAWVTSHKDDSVTRKKIEPAMYGWLVLAPRISPGRRVEKGEHAWILCAAARFVKERSHLSPNIFHGKIYI